MNLFNATSLYTLIVISDVTKVLPKCHCKDRTGQFISCLPFQMPEKNVNVKGLKKQMVRTQVHSLMLLRLLCR
jgi:hypothetical protein